MRCLSSTAPPFEVSIVTGGREKLNQVQHYFNWLVSLQEMYSNVVTEVHLQLGFRIWLEDDQLPCPVMVTVVDYCILFKVGCSTFISSFDWHKLDLLNMWGILVLLFWFFSEAEATILLKLSYLMSESFFYVTSATLFGRLAKHHQRWCSTYRR